MHGVGIGGGMHRDRRDAEFLARAQNAQGNLAAIGYQDLVEHRYCLFRHPEERALASLEGRRSVRQFNKFILRGSGFALDRKSTRLNSSHGYISYAVFCLKKKKKKTKRHTQ